MLLILLYIFKVKNANPKQKFFEWEQSQVFIYHYEPFLPGPVTPTVKVHITFCFFKNQIHVSDSPPPTTYYYNVN